ncbi:MAG: hypothetical protein IPI67_31910 [Myxococcales bacterium]|nr:hypothetical protein [Myxococcales bacterium]
MSPREILRHPLTRVFGAMLGFYLGLVLLTPGLWLRLAAKEGPLEHVGHVVVVAALGLWCVVAARAGGRARGLAIAAAVYLTLVVLEEIDWGEVYGVDLGHSLVARLTHGSPNFHNAQLSHGSLLGWSVVWMSGPMIVFFALPLAPFQSWRRFWASFDPAASTLIEAVVFFGAAAASVLIDGLPLLERRLGYVPRAGAGDPIGAPLGLFQITFYVAWWLVAWRALREISKRSGTGTPSGVP